MSALPDCPHCDAHRTLEPVAHDWYFCSCCAWTVLIQDGQVVRAMPPK